MNLIVVGVNHKTAPVEIREKLAFTGKHIEDSLRKLVEYTHLSESVILSTCNRVEIYARAHHKEFGIENIKSFLCTFHGLERPKLDEYLYSYANEETVEHLFKVSASLDSMVVGEPQILGQVKEAYSTARSVRTTGMLLNQLFERAFTAAKKVRAETSIAENAVSISYAAVELAKKIFDRLDDKAVMLVGAGEMSELAARHLVSNGVKMVMVSNRTFDRAVELARELKGNAIRFENFPDELERTDIVICSTAAPHFIIKKEDVEAALHRRKNQPMFFIDIAVPRNIDPAVNDIENVYLYNIDDLEGVIQSNKREREKEAQKGLAIVKKEVDQFLHWMDTLDAVPAIVALREKAEKIRLEEMEKTLNKWGDITDKERLAIDNMSAAMFKKFLHTPIVSLKKQTESRDGHWYLKVIKDLFNLD